MISSRDLLVQVIRKPEVITELAMTDWDLLLRQAQRADMLSRLCFILDEVNLLDKVPAQILAHFESARILAEGHERAVRWEVNRIGHALKGKEIPVILLKGAAYMMAGLPLGKGRIFVDIDLLVDKNSLDKAESAFLINGWVSGHHNAYDQRYFREWMHEIPPLKHIQRKSVLDVHHTILPLTADLNPDAEKLLAAAIPLKDNSQVYTLAPLDMVLHSATHLFHEGEFHHGFRGLTDLDGLLRHFSAEQQDFWPALIERAIELDLKKPLYYALTYTQAILGTPVPENAIGQIGEGVPNGLAAKLMDLLFLRALQPYHHSCDRRYSGLARWLLFVRAHYIRMPLHLLIPHLIRKATKTKKQL